MDNKRKLSSAFLKAAGQYMLVETPLAKADVCLVFGSNRYPDHIAQRTADLYHQGYFTTVVLSGGVPTDDGRIESERMRDVMVARGVPVNDILLESKATNTGQNVIHSMALLEQKVGLKNIRSILSVGNIYASRRFLMTLEKHWPDVIKMFATTNTFKTSKDSWYDDPTFREKVLNEYDKIQPYKDKGFIAEIDLEKIARQVAALPQPAKRGVPHDNRNKPGGGGLH